MTAAVDVRDAFRIHRSSGGNAVALQGLSLRVATGEIVAVLGPSGSGKTTLLRAIAAFEQLSAGSVHVLGTDVGALGGAAAARFRARHLGLLDQHYARALSPDLSCLHTVALGLELLGTPRTGARAAAAALLDRVGLGDRLDARPRELSGGEQQRVALCAALAHRPRLLLADEPAGELDAANAATVYGLIAELVREEGASALVVSHDRAATEIADRLVLVHDGRVVEEAPAGAETALVVNAPGWIRLPERLLDELGRPRLLRAEAGPGAVVLSSADASVAETPAPPTIRERPRETATAAELRQVVKRFEGAARPAIDGVSHAFESATFTAIVGRSGSGKTTLLHLLAGLDAPTSGEVVVRGGEIGRLDRAQLAALRREHIELVTQEPGLVPHLTACENVELGLRIRGFSNGVAHRAAEALAAVGLAPRLSHRADRLSAGERQRVAVARALAASPAILLADEPTARLDRRNAVAVAALLTSLAREAGSAVICATHDEAVIEQSDLRLLLAA